MSQVGIASSSHKRAVVEGEADDAKPHAGASHHTGSAGATAASQCLDDDDDGVVDPSPSGVPMSTGKFARRTDTYTSKDDFAYVPKTNRRECLHANISASDAAVFSMEFEEWLACEDRSAMRKCSVASPVGLPDLKRLAKGGIGSSFSIFTGDITRLQVDAIVNAANDGCLGGGGVDKAIHVAAGPLLRRECATFPGCESGHARITKGYNLPAKFVIHTVGPKGKNQPKTLTGCYRNSLELAKRHNLRSIAFCSISTGAYGYPEGEAAHIAIQTALEVVADPSNQIEHVCFVCFNASKEKTYAAVFQKLYKQFLAARPPPASEEVSGDIAKDVDLL